MSLYRSDTVDNRIDVHNLAVWGGCASAAEGDRRSVASLDIVHPGVLTAMGGLFLALDEAEEVWLAAVEVRVFKMPWFGVSVALEYTLLQLRNFMEPVHVKLSDKGSEFLVLEPATKDLARKALVIKN